MKISIIDSNYNDRKFSSLAASWLRWELKTAQIAECNPLTADFLLCTVSSQQGIDDLKREIRRTGNSKAKIILGGGGAWGPAVFENIADYICVGEGQRFVRTFLKDNVEGILKLPETWIKGDEKKVMPSNTFPWDCPPIKHPDGTVRVWGARGCKKKCLFCQTGWEQKYNPNKDVQRLQNQIDLLINNGYRVAVITNDGAEESVKIGGRQEFLSVSYEYLKKTKITKNLAKSVRIGVEGVSERLRRAIKKPIDNDGLLKITSDCFSMGIGVRWFFIAGLPFEKTSDWEELKYLVKNLHGIDKGVCMMNFHAFVPQPATPLCVFPLVDEYWERFDNFRTWFFNGIGFTRHVQIVNPAHYKGRLKRAKESMCANVNELRTGWFEKDNKNWRVKYLLDPVALRRIAFNYAKEAECPAENLYR
jgi:radical SAM superfamily enzyme YgiQ (UPF0313 family)